MFCDADNQPKYKFASAIKSRMERELLEISNSSLLCKNNEERKFSIKWKSGESYLTKEYQTRGCYSQVRLPNTRIDLVYRCNEVKVVVL